MQDIIEMDSLYDNVFEKVKVLKAKLNIKGGGVY